MFRKIYKEMNMKVSPDKALIYKTIQLAQEAAGSVSHRSIRFKLRPAAAVAIALVCVFTAVPVLAANVPAAYEFLYQVSPETAQFFKPVQKSCERNGIKMEVVSTYIHDDTAEIYVSLRDLEENRVDETTDLYDSYSIHCPFDSTAHCEFVSFDKKTKAATFLITVTVSGNHKIEGDKLTFSLREFISDKHEYEDVPLNIDWNGYEGSAPTRTVTANGGSGIDIQLLDGSFQALASSCTLFTPAAGLNVTGIGYVGDELHIQLSASDNLKYDNHGFFYLKDGRGNSIQSNYSVHFTEYSPQDSGNIRTDFNEFVFEIPQSEIDDYALYGNFYTSGLNTSGNWQVTFPLSDSNNS